MRATTIGILLVLLLVAGVAAAESPDIGEVDGLRWAGRYGDAEAKLDELAAAHPSDAAVAAARADLFLELGRFEDAAEAAAKGGDDARCLALLGESLLARGRLDEAGAALSKAVAADPSVLRARYDQGLLALQRGDREGAKEAFSWFFDYYATNDVEGPENLTLVAKASIRLAELQPDVDMNFQPTSDLLQTVTKKHEQYLPARVAMGRLYLSLYQDQDAKKEFETALRQNPRYPPALLGLAEQSAFRFDELGGVARCESALLTNPNLFAAREFIAKVRLGDSQYDAAKEHIDAVLAVNPRRKPARGLAAAAAYLVGKRDAFEKDMKALLDDDPRFAGGYVDLVEILEQQRRFGEAADLAKTATAVDPESWRAFWALGRNLVHESREKEAREALVQSRRLDPFAYYGGNPFRENMIEVLGHIEEFVETRTPNFVYKIHVGENAVLSRYYHDFMEKSWRMLTEKYGFTPDGPILTEIFHRHDDFAARTIGLPGIGALGACFGKVITLDSPSARGPGEFVWASTAHHEFAHVMTLQLSRGRVPRWFTEGMSVYEERACESWWERDMDRRLFDVFANDEIHPVADFNRAFRGGDVLFAYYLGGMMCEFVAETYGIPKIVEMLKAWGEDRQTPEVLQSVLGLTSSGFDAKFREWVGARVSGWKLVPNWSAKTMKAMQDRIGKAGKDVEALVTVAWGHYQRGNTVDAMNYLGRALAVAPDDPRLMLLRGEIGFRSGRMDQARKWYEQYLAAGGDAFSCRYHYAKVLEAAGDFEGAVKQYEAAKACFPRSPEPFAELARLKKGENDLDGAMKETEGLVRLVNTDLPHRLELADYYQGRGDREKLAEILTEVVWIYPLGEKSAMTVHVRLADALKELGRGEPAVREYEVALDLGVPKEEEPAVRVKLGQALLLLGKVREARFQAKAALELDPSFTPAEDLLEGLTGR